MLWEFWIENEIRYWLEEQKMEFIDPCRAKSIDKRFRFGINPEAMAKKNGWVYVEKFINDCWYIPTEVKITWGMKKPKRRRK